MYKHASDQFRAVLQEFPDQIVARQWLAESLEQLWEDNPESFHAQSSLGWVCLRCGNPAKALEHFERAVRICPEHPMLAAFRAAALSALGRHGDAVPIFDEVARAAPDFFTYYAHDIKEYVERSRAALRQASDQR